jgi:hypothetical protein
VIIFEKKIMRISVLFLLLLTQSVAGQIPFNVPAQGLIGYYPLGGQVQDYSGANRHGTATNALPTIDRFGRPGEAYFLNGTNAFLTIPATVMTQAAGNAFSVSIWVAPDTIIPGSPGMELISDKVSSSWLHRFRIAFGAIAGGYSPDSAYFDAIIASNVVPRTTAQKPDIEGWTHYVFVYQIDSGGSIRAYRNGQLTGQRLSSGGVSINNPINVGRAVHPQGPSGTNFYKGRVDEIGVWNRALSAAEIVNLYAPCGFQFNVQPLSGQWNIGDTATFSTLTNDTNSHYSWEINSGSGYVPLSASATYQGVDSAVLVVNNVDFSMNGQLFRCKVWKDSSCFTYSFVGVLNIICPQKISQQPLNATAPFGDTVLLTVQGNSPGLNYQWQSNIGGTFTNLVNNVDFNGVNTDSLRVFLNNPQLGGMTFRCLVSDAICAETSQPATINFLCINQISQQPQNDTVFPGIQANFQVASTALGQISYQWQRRTSATGSFFNLNNSFDFAGVNTPNLQINFPTVSMNQHAFRCVLSYVGTCKDTTSVAMLRVACNSILSAQPRDTALLVGQTAQFTVAALPSLNPTYNWQLRLPGSTNWTSITNMPPFPVRIVLSFPSPQ